MLLDNKTNNGHLIRNTMYARSHAKMRYSLKFRLKVRINYRNFGGFAKIYDHLLKMRFSCVCESARVIHNELNPMTSDQTLKLHTHTHSLT